MLELDKYYTPEDVASSLLFNNFDNKINVCVDTTCGEGSLLRAASNVYGNINFVGMDIDKNVINSLKRSEPKWILSVANLLKYNSLKKAKAFNAYKDKSDLLLLNPPFSHNGKKHIYTDYNGIAIKTSIAMSYVLKSIQFFKPTSGAMIILPESALYSDTDINARKELDKDYSIKIIQELNCMTFNGTRANTVIIKLTRRKNPLKYSRKFTNQNKFVEASEKTIKLNIVRGLLENHRSEKSRKKSAVHFIHSTDIKTLVNKYDDRNLKKVFCTKKGKVKGINILLPRVGKPKCEYLTPINLINECQLSDCVIALNLMTKKDALNVSRILKDNFNEFIDLYKGTAARYITISRLQNWLLNKNILATIIK